MITSNTSIVSSTAFHSLSLSLSLSFIVVFFLKLSGPPSNPNNFLFFFFFLQIGLLYHRWISSVLHLYLNWSPFFLLFCNELVLSFIARKKTIHPKKQTKTKTKKGRNGKKLCVIYILTMMIPSALDYFLSICAVYNFINIFITELCTNETFRLEFNCFILFFSFFIFLRWRGWWNSCGK